VEVLEKLKKQCRRCRRCGLHATRREAVPGEGDMPADVLFIGEGPGKGEDVTGRPFIGMAGKRVLRPAIEWLQKKVCTFTYFIANVVACRPTDSKGGKNRQPTELEALACMPRLIKTAGMVEPKLIVLMGETAQMYYSEKFTAAVQVQHPAFVLRTGAQASPYYRVFLRTIAEALENLQR